MMTMHRILVADDYTPFRETVMQVLTLAKRDWVVDQARDGHEALRMAERLLPDLVLMDVGMPGLSGFEATRAIRRQHPEVKVIVLLATDSLEYRLAARECGAQGSVAKERIDEELIQVINQCAATSQKHEAETPRLAQEVQQGMIPRPGGLFPSAREGARKERVMRAQWLDLVGWGLVAVVAAAPFAVMFIMAQIGAFPPVEVFLPMVLLHYAAVFLMVMALCERTPREATKIPSREAPASEPEPVAKKIIT